MTRLTRFPHAMTLRLSHQMDDELESMAWARRSSKAGTIRRILARAIAEAAQGVQNSHFEDRDGIA